MSISKNPHEKRVFYLDNEIVAEIRHDSLFGTPDVLSGFVWDRYKDVEC